jgi:hypothetical protein
MASLHFHTLFGQELPGNPSGILHGSDFGDQLGLGRTEEYIIATVFKSPNHQINLSSFS